MKCLFDLFKFVYLNSVFCISERCVENLLLVAGKKPFSSNSILTALIFFFDIFSRKIFENQEVIYEDDVTSLYLACLTHSVLIF